MDVAKSGQLLLEGFAEIPKNKANYVMLWCGSYYWSLLQRKGLSFFRFLLNTCLSTVKAQVGRQRRVFLPSWILWKWRMIAIMSCANDVSRSTEEEMGCCSALQDMHDHCKSQVAHFCPTTPKNNFKCMYTSKNHFLRRHALRRGGQSRVNNVPTPCEYMHRTHWHVAQAETLLHPAHRLF